MTYTIVKIFDSSFTETFVTPKKTNKDSLFSYNLEKSEESSNVSNQILNIESDIEMTILPGIFTCTHVTYICILTYIKILM